VKIADVLCAMITRSANCTEHLSLDYMGMRVGENLFEELLDTSDATKPTAHQSLLSAELNGKHQAGRVVTGLIDVKARKVLSDAEAPALGDLLEKLFFHGKAIVAVNRQMPTAQLRGTE
jgi:FlaA1/EpsC-like NDP-sugar epimerase